MAKTLYIIDGHALIYAAYFAPMSQRLTSPAGEPTKAIYIFTTAVLGLINSADMRATRSVPVRVGAMSRVHGVPVQSARGSECTAIGSGVEIRLSSGRVIALGMQYGEVELARVIRMLEVLPC